LPDYPKDYVKKINQPERHLHAVAEMSATAIKSFLLLFFKKEDLSSLP
jgi:hypothetical protein